MMGAQGRRLQARMWLSVGGGRENSEGQEKGLSEG